MRIPGLVLSVLVVLSGGLSIFWFYAAHRSGAALDTWMTEEAAQGRTWTCPDRAIAGFPFAIDVTCNRPTFAGRVLEDQVQGSLAGLNIRATLLDPHHATVTLQPPFAYRTADRRTDFSIGWAKMDVRLGGLPARVDLGTASGVDITVQGRFGAPDPVSVRADKGDMTIHKLRKADVPTVEFSIAFGGAAVPPLDALVGDAPTPANLDLAGRLTHAVLIDAPTSADLIEGWRQAGGSITFWSASLSRGLSRVEASGPLRLDDEHRIAGKLDANFVGLGPILRRYGINPNIVHAGALLNSLFGSKDPAKQAKADPNTIQLPIVFRDGRLGIGPLVTPVQLTPLY